jgi:hypothetical protein
MLRIVVDGLVKGDEIRLVTAQGVDVLLEAPGSGDFKISYPMEAPGFARVEVWRAFLPGVLHLPALLSNPIYFDPE